MKVHFNVVQVELNLAHSKSHLIQGTSIEGCHEDGLFHAIS